MKFRLLAGKVSLEMSRICPRLDQAELTLAFW